MAENANTAGNNELRKPVGFLNAFVAGARKGFNLTFNVIVPNSLYAFILIYLFNQFGIMDFLGRFLNPVMGLLGLPGEAIVPIALSYISTSSGVVAAAQLVATGSLTAHQLTVVLPFLFLIGAMLQYLGRILGPSGIAAKWYMPMVLIGTLNGIVSVYVMHFLLSFIN